MAVTAFSYIDMHVVALDLKQLSSKYLTKTIGFQFIKYIKFATLESDFHRFLQISSNGNVDQFISIFFKECFFTHSHIDTGCKLNVHKMFRRHPGRFLNVFVRSIYVLCLQGLLLEACAVQARRLSWIFKKVSLWSTISAGRH